MHFGTHTQPPTANDTPHATGHAKTKASATIAPIPAARLLIFSTFYTVTAKFPPHSQTAQHFKTNQPGKHIMKPQDLQTLAAAALAAPQPMRWNDSAEPAQPAAVTAAAALAAKVDELGQLHAAIAKLKKDADQLRTELEDAGLTDIEGQLFRVNFATVAGSTLTNWRAIAERLKASPQLIRAYTKTGEPSTRMTVKAHPTH
jgi:hypothetical protein